MDIKKVVIGKGQMPERCMDCPLVGLLPYGTGYCQVLWEFLDAVVLIRKRHPDCPLVESEETI